MSPTCGEALGDLPDAETFSTLLGSDNVKTNAFKEPSVYAAEMRALSKDSWHFGYMRNWNSNILTSSARTNHTSISRRRFGETLNGKVEPISRFFKLPIDGVANTLRAGTDGARGAFTSPRPIHYKYNRCITVREMARLHGFPDWFRFHTTKWHGARQIGNAVPPPLARAVAYQISDALELVKTKPLEVLDLGDVKLLSFTVTQAANYFGTVAPCQKRDRRSGITKRKQTDIQALKNFKTVS